MFGVVPDHGLHRRPTDVVRVIVGLVVFLVGAVGAVSYSSWERATHDVVASVPRPILQTFSFVDGIGTGVAIALVLVVALAVRRPRFIAAVVLAAGVGAGLALGLQHLIDAPAAIDAAAKGITGYPQYPSMLLTMVAAVFIVATPEITRPFRRLLLWTLVLIAVAGIAAHDGYPSGIVGSLGLAWALAAAIHLALGSPDGMPDPAGIETNLSAIGEDVTDLEASRSQTWGTKSFTGRSGDHRVRVVSIGRDATDGQLLSKVLRWLWYKDSGPTLDLTNQQQIEHHAYLLLLAERRGAHVPSVVWTGRLGERRDATLLARISDGHTFASPDHAPVTGAVLASMWSELGKLHDAGIAHGGIWAGQFRSRTPHTVEFTDLGTADADPDESSLLSDQVALLVTTAELTDDDRAVTAARTALGDDALVALLPMLQATALPRVSRHTADNAKKRCAALRDAIATATGTEAPKLTELRRVAPSSILVAAFTILGIYLLIGEFSHVEWGQMFTDAEWWWLPAVILFAQIPIFALSLSILGSVSKPLPLRPVLLLEVGTKFTNLAGGGVATLALQVRFFQKQGLAAAVAVTSSLLNSVASGTVEVTLMTLALITGAGSFHIPHGGAGSIASKVFLVAVVIAVITAVAFGIPAIRHRVGGFVMPQIRSAWDNLRNVLRDPRKGSLMIGGNLLSQIAYAMVLWAALHMYGHSLGLVQLIIINTLASILGGIAPVPGGIGVIEAGLIAGLTAAGVPDQAAIATTFTARLFTAYLPPIWGWMSIAWMRRRDYV